MSGVNFQLDVVISHLTSLSVCIWMSPSYIISLPWNYWDFKKIALHLTPEWGTYFRFTWPCTNRFHCLTRVKPNWFKRYFCSCESDLISCNQMLFYPGSWSPVFIPERFCLDSWWMIQFAPGQNYITLGPGCMSARHDHCSPVELVFRLVKTWGFTTADSLWSTVPRTNVITSNNFMCLRRLSFIFRRSAHIHNAKTSPCLLLTAINFTRVMIVRIRSWKNMNNSAL